MILAMPGSNSPTPMTIAATLLGAALVLLSAFNISTNRASIAINKERIGRLEAEVFELRQIIGKTRGSVGNEPQAASFRSGQRSYL